ncbi:hypothetical protein [Geopsychrobacter electrodiphilus]|uniref:hypothetical protein n=1 Tax=Geopsychrobacter electrodiphilus TaxID=225196 RepID=UPI00035CF043|nr:hypothetical protein [Geopsychrobacter electrodiphilus]
MNPSLLVRALALSRLSAQLRLSEYQRLYFGAEFCSWAMPVSHEVLRARRLAREAGLGFTLMTPVLREETLVELAALFKLLAADWQFEDELLISDLGTLETARRYLPEAQIILGRALSGQKRGPRIEALALSVEAAEYFRQGSWYSREAVQLLVEIGIHRVELDNLLQGIAPLPRALVGSVHIPWLMVTSSRNCPYHPDKSGRRCTVNCGEAFSLCTPQTPQLLMQAGNSQFIENRNIPSDLGALRIDRLVEHPALPR